MIRLLAIQLGLFLLPFLAWGLKRALAGDVGGDGVFAGAPKAKLAIAGLVLVVAAFLALAAFEGGSASGVYVPDRFENGRLVPGHFE